MISSKKRAAILSALGEAYYACGEEVARIVASEPDLDTLEKILMGLSPTNCWWAAFRSAPMAIEAIREERIRRSDRTADEI